MVMFSIKSACKVHVNMKQRESIRESGGDSANCESRSSLFRSIWKLQCPPKVQHFMWRFAHNSHPPLMNIARRGVHLDTCCSVCHHYFKDGGQLFLKCKQVKARWCAILLQEVRLSMLKHNAPLDILAEVQELPYEQKMLVIAFLWCWTERNKSNHKEGFSS